MAVGICRACDQMVDESDFDWEEELCWDCAADREEDENER